MALAAAPAFAQWPGEARITEPDPNDVLMGSVDVWVEGDANGFPGSMILLPMAVIWTGGAAGEWTYNQVASNPNGSLTDCKVGTWNTTTASKGTGQMKVRFTWGAGGVTKDTTAITVTLIGDFTITDCVYEFIPQGGDFDNGTGFTATVSPGGINGTIKFQLVSTSEEPGYCLNAGTETDKDLKFDNGSQERVYTNVNSVGTTVYCYDYGAYGWIRATFTKGGCTLIAHVVNGSATLIKIPRDRNNNDIADKWEVDEGLASDPDDMPANPAITDNETDPVGDGTAGDGYTLYEEYRGFLERGDHTRTGAKKFQPKKKDIFLIDDGIWDGGCLAPGYFPASGLVVHVVSFDSDEWAQGRVMNYNFITHHNEIQYGIYVWDGKWSDEYNGECVPTVPGNCTYTLPGCSEAKIYTQTIRYDGPPTRDLTTWDPKDVECRQNTVGHECGHHVGMHDHGNTHEAATSCIMYNPETEQQKLLWWLNIPTEYKPPCPSLIRLH